MKTIQILKNKNKKKEKKKDKESSIRHEKEIRVVKDKKLLNNKIDKKENIEFVSKKYKEDIQKMGKNAEVISIPSLNRFVHSYDVSPSPDHLKAMWNSSSKFIVVCLNSKTN